MQAKRTFAEESRTFPEFTQAGSNMENRTFPFVALHRAASDLTSARKIQFSDFSRS